MQHDMAATPHAHSVAAAGGAGAVPSGRHGTLEGHVLPGVMFIVWGAWWTAHFVAESRAAALVGESGGAHKRRSSPRHFRSTAWYRAPALACLPATLEPLCKAVLPLIGFADEAPWAPLFDAHGAIIHEQIHGLQHTLMYASICFSGVLDLAYLRYPALPPGLDALALAAGFASQGFILMFHLSAGPQLDVRLHLLLVVASYAVAAAIGLALLLPRSQLAAFARCVSILTLGSFYIQTGDLIYTRPAFDSNEGATLAPSIFVTHVGGWSLLLLGALLLAGAGGAPAAAGAAPHADGDSSASDEEAGAKALAATALQMPVTARNGKAAD